MKPTCAGHCNDPNAVGARYATPKGWLCGRCWSILDGVPTENTHMMKKKAGYPAKKPIAKPKAIVKKAAPKAARKKGR